MSNSAGPVLEPGPVALTTQNLDRLLRFYERCLGMQLLSRAETPAVLGSADGRPLLHLYEDPQAAPRPRSAPGLYHFAVLLPSRAHLAEALRRLVENNCPLQGSADHWVSEALYLADPDGNGIEIYRDRPRAEWPYQNGQLQMSSEALDLRKLLAEAQASAETMPAGTRMGHVHLKVGSIPGADDFYIRQLGMDLMLHFGPQAGFVSSGGYHHHIGYNTWESGGGAPPPADSAGLRYFSLLLPSQAALEEIASRLQSAGASIEREAGPGGSAETGSLFTRDPSGNRLLLTVQNFS